MDGDADAGALRKNNVEDDGRRLEIGLLSAYRRTRDSRSKRNVKKKIKVVETSVREGERRDEEMAGFLLALWLCAPARSHASNHLCRASACLSVSAKFPRAAPRRAGSERPGPAWTHNAIPSAEERPKSQEHVDLPRIFFYTVNRHSFARKNFLSSHSTSRLEFLHVHSFYINELIHRV